MSILIRGMEMPEAGVERGLVIDSDGDVFYCLSNPFGWMKEKIDDCQAVEVPTQHGRLGDLDHIAEFISNMLKHEDGNLKTWSDYEVLDMIESSPTIIEAEGEGE